MGNTVYMCSRADLVRQVLHNWRPRVHIIIMTYGTSGRFQLSAFRSPTTNVARSTYHHVILTVHVVIRYNNKYSSRDVYAYVYVCLLILLCVIIIITIRLENDNLVRWFSVWSFNGDDMIINRYMYYDTGSPTCRYVWICIYS